MRGLINVQYAVKDSQVFVIEANPRASRTVPFVAKATGVPLAKVAARVMVGATLAELRAEGLLRRRRSAGHVAVKEAVLPFNRFPEVDTGARPRDALDRRGDGHRPHVRAGVRQEPSWRPATALPQQRHRVPVARRPRQAGRAGRRRAGFASSGSGIVATQGTADYLGQLRRAGRPGGRQGPGRPTAAGPRST